MQYIQAMGYYPAKDQITNLCNKMNEPPKHYIK